MRHVRSAFDSLVLQAPPASHSPVSHSPVSGNAPRKSLARRLAAASVALSLAAPALHVVQAATSRDERVASTFSSLDALLGGAETVVVNGLTVHRASVDVGSSAKAVLDAAEATCEAGRTPESTLFANEAQKRIPTAPEHARRSLDALTRGVLRSEDDGSGTLVCFAPTDATGDRPFWDRVRELARTGRVDALGAFRYVSVTAGTPEKSHLTAHWSKEPVDPSRLFPEHGDAPGDDSANVPRPPHGRRLLTARAAGMPHAVRVYETDDDAASLKAHYERALDRADLTAVPQNDPRALAYLTQDLGMVLVVVKDLRTARTVTLVETADAKAHGPSSR